MHHECMFLKWNLHPKWLNKIKARVNYWYLETHFGQLLRSSKMILIIVDNAKDICWSVLQWIDDQRWVDGCRRPDDRIMKRWRDKWLPNYSHQIQQQLCVSSIFNCRQHFDLRTRPELHAAGHWSCMHRAILRNCAFNAASNCKRLACPKIAQGMRAISGWLANVVVVVAAVAGLKGPSAVQVS